MLYIGNFSFDYEDEDNQPRNGGFVYVIEADSADDAVDKFEKNLNDTIKKKSDLLYGDIYLDGVLEIKKLSKEGALGFYKNSSGEPPVSIESNLPLESKGVNCFEWLPDGEEQSEQEEIDGRTVDPFLIAPSPKKKKPKTSK